MKLDTSIGAIIKAVASAFICVYVWVESIGVDAYAFFVLSGLMFLDFLLGFTKAIRIFELNNPSSKAARNGIVVKTIMFMLPVIAGLLWGLFSKEGGMKVANTLLVALCLAEGFSVIGNGYIIVTGKLLSEFDAFTFIFKSVSNGIKKILVKSLESFNK